MGKQKFDRMKKTIAILLAVLFVTSLSAVAAVADHGGHGGGGHGGFGGGYGGFGGFDGGWGGPGFGWGGPLDFTHLRHMAQHLGLAPVDLMDASVLLTTHTLCRLS